MTDDHTTHDHATDDATTDDDPDSPVTSGVLAADSSSRDQLASRRRRLVSSAALGLVIVLAVVGGAALVQRQANERARQAAAVAEAEAAFATDVVDQAEEYERPALQVGIDAPVLRDALEDHLTVTDAAPAEVDATVERVSASLTEQAAVLDRLRDRELPAPDVLVDGADAVTVLEQLEALRTEAGALVEELTGTTRQARTWSDAVRAVDAALAAHAAVVESKPDSDDPEDLAAGWRSEVPPLEALIAVAEQAAQDAPGLAPWAQAHVEYARATIDFVDEAVALLEDGQLDAYNALFLDTFGTEDPFGFQAAARAGAVEALADDPVVAAAGLSERSTIVIDTLTALEELVASRFGDDPAA